MIMKRMVFCATVVLLIFGIARQGKADSWADKVKVGADARYRHEIIDVEDNEHRTRHRVRARLKLTGEVTDEWEVVIQLASGSDDPVSTNQTLDEAFTTKGIGLDLAYIDWHPGFLEGLHVDFGKSKNPFFKPGKTELIWDSDLNPEGLSLTYASEPDTFGLLVNGGYFYVEERDGDDDDTMLWGAQGGLRIGGGTYVILGGGYFEYTELKEFAAPLYDDDSFGNELLLDGTFAHDYQLTEFFGQAGTKLGGYPVSVFGDYVTNNGIDDDNDMDDEDDNVGWLAGLSVGKCKDARSWAARLNYRELESDAVFAIFTDSDFIGGGTNGKGYEAGFDFGLAENVKFSVTYFDNIIGIGDDDEEIDYNRWQIDISAKI
jgi:hypothetical protein